VRDAFELQRTARTVNASFGPDNPIESRGSRITLYAHPRQTRSQPRQQHPSHS